MTIYLMDGEDRVILDTSKAFLRYEEKEIDLTGNTLFLYNANYVVADGTMGENNEPCKVMIFTDRFTGMTIEIPIPLPAADDISEGLKTGETMRHQPLGRKVARLLKTK